jgi:hypothetical protein
MAIVHVTPERYGRAKHVSVESNAPDNVQAIIEIGDWAAEHGLVRENEYWLEQSTRNGKRVFRCECYRLTNEDKRRIRAAIRRNREILKRMPATEHVGRYR